MVTFYCECLAIEVWVEPCVWEQNNKQLFYIYMSEYEAKAIGCPTFSRQILRPLLDAFACMEMVLEWS